MLQPIFGSKSRVAVLVFLVRQPEGYASEIAGAAGLDLFAVQQQLARLEDAGLLSSRRVGRKRVYALNPRYPLLGELRRLIRKAVALQPPSQSSRSSTRLPKNLETYFWDYPFEQLAWEADRGPHHPSPAFGRLMGGHHLVAKASGRRSPAPMADRPARGRSQPAPAALMVAPLRRTEKADRRLGACRPVRCLGPTTKFHLEGLNSRQIKILRSTGKMLSDGGFYLCGGTALAIYFGHRTSVDLDWFLPTALEDALVLAQSLRSAGLAFTTTQTGPGALHGTISGVRLSFQEFRYPLLRPLSLWNEMKCPLASLDDLACMKLSAIAQRGERKDFCDLYFLGTRHRPLQEMLQLYRRKFQVRDISPVLYGLSYFDEAQSERMPRMLSKVPWATMKKTIEGWVKELGRL